MKAIEDFELDDKKLESYREGVLEKDHACPNVGAMQNQESIGQYDFFDEVIHIVVAHPYLNATTIIHECTHGEDRILGPWCRGVGWLQSLIAELIEDLLERSKQVKRNLSLPLASEENLRTPFEKDIITITNCYKLHNHMLAMVAIPFEMNAFFRGADRLPVSMIKSSLERMSTIGNLRGRFYDEKLLMAQYSKSGDELDQWLRRCSKTVVDLARFSDPHMLALLSCMAIEEKFGTLSLCLVPGLSMLGLPEFKRDPLENLEEAKQQLENVNPFKRTMEIAEIPEKDIPPNLRKDGHSLIDFVYKYKKWDFNEFYGHDARWFLTNIVDASGIPENVSSKFKRLIPKHGGRGFFSNLLDRSGAKGYALSRLKEKAAFSDVLRAGKQIFPRLSNPCHFIVCEEYDTKRKTIRAIKHSVSGLDESAETGPVQVLMNYQFSKGLIPQLLCLKSDEVCCPLREILGCKRLEEDIDYYDGFSSRVAELGRATCGCDSKTCLFDEYMTRFG